MSAPVGAGEAGKGAVMIRIIDVLIQRDGRVWLMPQRVQLGTVKHEARGSARGWRAKCDRCSPWYTAIGRTRRDAVRDLIDHWNEDEQRGALGTQRG